MAAFIPPPHSDLTLHSVKTPNPQILSLSLILSRNSFSLIILHVKTLHEGGEMRKLFQSLAGEAHHLHCPPIPFFPEYLIQLLIVLIKIDITTDAERIKRFLHFFFPHKSVSSLVFIAPRVIDGRRGSICIANFIGIKCELCP